MKFLTIDNLIDLRIIISNELSRQTDKFNGCSSIDKKIDILKKINKLSCLFDTLTNEIYN